MRALQRQQMAAASAASAPAALIEFKAGRMLATPVENGAKFRVEADPRKGLLALRKVRTANRSPQHLPHRPHAARVADLAAIWCARVLTVLFASSGAFATPA